MELIISKPRIQSLKAQTVLRQFHCESLAVEFEDEGLTTNQKAGLAYRWDDMLKESQVLQLMLDLLERQERRRSPVIAVRDSPKPRRPPLSAEGRDSTNSIFAVSS
jgi:hypothetical protein